MIEIEDHSRMIPGAEAPLNSIAQMSVLPATRSQPPAAARRPVPLGGYTRQMEVG
jgi:hypothetical protein